MKAALVAKQNSLISLLSELNINGKTIEVEHFTNPIKAYDFITEYEYDILFLSSFDYPRHWSMIAQSFQQKNRDSFKPLILFYRESQSIDFNKACFLGVNIFINVNDENSNISDYYRKIFDYFRSLTTNVSGLGMPDFKCVFLHPYEGNLVEGKIIGISQNVIEIIPDMPQLTYSLCKGTEIAECYIKNSDKIVQCKALVEYNNNIMKLTLDNFVDDRFQLLHYIIDHKESTYEHHKVSGDKPS